MLESIKAGLPAWLVPGASALLTLVGNLRRLSRCVGTDTQVYPLQGRSPYLSRRGGPRPGRRFVSAGTERGPGSRTRRPSPAPRTAAFRHAAPDLVDDLGCGALHLGHR